MRFVRSILTTLIPCIAVSGCVRSGTYEALRKEHEQLMAQCRREAQMVHILQAQLQRALAYGNAEQNECDAVDRVKEQLAQVVAERDRIRGTIDAYKAQLDAMKKDLEDAKAQRKKSQF